MKVTDDLYTLITSLTKSEKRHFKLVASKHIIGDENKYVKLFDAILKQEVYDEKKLRQELSKSVSVKFLSADRNYLFNLILKSLEISHNDIDARIQGVIRHIRILFSKRLYVLSLKQIEKAKRISKKYERHLALTEILHWEFEVMRALGYKGRSEKELSMIFTESLQEIDSQREVVMYRSLIAKLFIRYSKYGFVNSKEDEKFYNEIIGHPLFKNEKKLKTYNSRYAYYHCHTAYYFLRHDFEHAYYYVKKLSELIEDNFHQVEEKPKQYITTMNNLIVCEMSLKKYKELSQTIEKLRSYNCDSEEAKHEVFYLSNITELELYINTGQFEEGNSLSESIEEKMAGQDEKGKNAQYERTLSLTMAIACFGNKNYKSAIRSLNKILNDSSLDSRSDIYYYSKILSLIVYFEMGKQDLLEYAVRSAYRFFVKNKRLNKFESVILDFIRNKAPQTNSEKELIKAFTELKNELEKIKADPQEAGSLRFFDIITWLESKIEKRTFAELVKEKASVYMN